MQEYKIIFCGPPASGKTTAISQISTSTVTTEVESRDFETHPKKSTTTVAMDFSQIVLKGIGTISLYGTPGQKRFSYMWDILSQGSLGIILLFDRSRIDTQENLLYFVEHFTSPKHVHPVVIGVSQHGPESLWSHDSLSKTLLQANFNIPIFSVDIRNRDHVILLVNTVVYMLEANYRCLS